MTVAAVLSTDPNQDKNMYENQPLSEAVGLSAGGTGGGSAGVGVGGQGGNLRSVTAAAATVYVSPPRYKGPTVTVVNPNVSGPRDAEIVIRGAALKSGSATVLTNSDIHAHNTFDQKQVGVPETRAIEIKGEVLHYVFPPASVTKLSLMLS